MRIASWNVCFRNTDWDAAFACIGGLDADLLCLQEVPEHFLSKLKTLPYHRAIGVDVDRLFPSGTERNYLVILSKYPLVRSGSVSFSLPHLPLRTRLFVWTMRRKGWSKIEGRTALWADIEYRGKLIRIFCLHLLLAHPRVRAAEFELAMKASGEGEHIVCGDFNILEYPKATILNWILGGPLIDAFRFTRERHEMERRFAAYGIKNPLRGKWTHNYSTRQQLAHILVPNDAAVKNAQVLPEWHGSDHRPIFVDCELPPPSP